MALLGPDLSQEPPGVEPNVPGRSVVVGANPRRSTARREEIT